LSAYDVYNINIKTDNVTPLITYGTNAFLKELLKTQVEQGFQFEEIQVTNIQMIETYYGGKTLTDSYRCLIRHHVCCDCDDAPIF